MSSTVKVHRGSLKKWLRQYQDGKRSKFEIERTEFGITNARGQFITRLWFRELGVNTVTPRVPVTV